MEIERGCTSKVTLSLTPLIDVVFLLVIFFMLTTSFATNEGIEINFADSSSTVAASGDNKIITVLVGEEGKVFLDGKEYSINSFRRTLRDELFANENSKIVVRSKDKATVQNIITIIDQIHLAGASDISFVD